MKIFSFQDDTYTQKAHLEKKKNTARHYKQYKCTVRHDCVSVKVQL